MTGVTGHNYPLDQLTPGDFNLQFLRLKLPRISSARSYDLDQLTLGTFSLTDFSGWSYVGGKFSQVRLYNLTELTPGNFSEGVYKSWYTGLSIIINNNININWWNIGIKLCFWLENVNP